MESRVEKAIALFKNGYNCSQAVFVAYSDLYGLDESTAFKLSTSFGGGLGGTRNVCGAVSGMSMIAGLAKGTDQPHDKEGKKVNYETVQLLVNEFEKENGSIVCGELLGLKPTDIPLKKRPCVEYVRMCAELLEKHLLTNESE